MKCRFIFSDDFNSILYPNIPFFTLPSNPLQSHFTARPTKHAREIYFTFYSLFDCGNQLDNKKLGISSNLGMVHNLDGANHHLFAHKLILNPMLTSNLNIDTCRKGISGAAKEQK